MKGERKILCIRNIACIDSLYRLSDSTLGMDGFYAKLTEITDDSDLVPEIREEALKIKMKISH
jgi:hypothetical protein